MEEEDLSKNHQDARTFLPQFDDEKPLFHNSHTPPGPSEPFQLSGSEVQVPLTINRYLRDYQREGIKFIYNNYAKSRGCILGDDMGLGKTVQVIGFLAAVMQKTGTWQDVENNRPQFLRTQSETLSEQIQKIFLIVAPLSVLYNWKDELDTWGHFRVVVVHGIRKDEELVRVQRGRCEIALTTYETLRLCLEEFNSVDWAAVIVDEAHKIKNHKSQITRAMKAMKCKVRIGLTGTILQNNLEELWCVMDWAVPGCLGSQERFKNRFSDPIQQGQKHTVTKRSLAEARKAVQDLAKKLSRWFLRRTKAIISDQLPKKDDRVVYCSLTDFQQSVYQAVLDTEDVNMILKSSGKCPCSSGRTRKKCCFKVNAAGEPVRNLYFSYLAILRKVANHVALLQTKEGTSKKQENYVTAICERVFKKFPDFTERCKRAAFEAMSDPMYSGKMKVLQKLLNHFSSRKDKVLLFSLSTKLLDVLESYCMAEGLEYHRLDGSTNSKERVKIVREFNSSRDVNLCLVSTLAGGLGLNFIGANVVVLFDPTWNPANDLQAIDRVYRIGQCRDVTVFRLVSLGTVEEIIYLRQIYKQQLQSSVVGQENARRYFEAVQGPDGKAGELFGIRNLFRLQTDGTCLTHRILEREGRVEVGIMTARTQAVDERMQESDHLRTADAVAQRASVSAATGFKPAALLDFSSGSEDEDPCCSKPRSTQTHTAEQIAANTTYIGSTGLYSLLQRRMDERGLQETDTEEDSSSLSQDEATTQTKGQISRSESEDEMEGCSNGVRKIKSAEVFPSRDSRQLNDRSIHSKNEVYKRAKFANHSENNIESFSSSEDEAPGKTLRFTSEKKNTTRRSRSKMRHGALQTSGFEKTQSRDEGKTGTLDSLLGGLQHVSYTHSNQKVVGSSRAEDRLSHAAVRDVFELHKHSQLPANHILDFAETQPSDPILIDQLDGGEKTPTTHGRLLGKHPVTHTIKTTHRQNNLSVIVGETPNCICRSQFEEMAQLFGFDSMHEFAQEILKSNSEQRLKRLQSFYNQKFPELQTLIEKTFGKPGIESDLSRSPPLSLGQRPALKRAHTKSALKSQDQVLTPTVENQCGTLEKNRKKEAETSEPRCHSSKIKSGPLPQRNYASDEEIKPCSSRSQFSRPPCISTDDCGASNSSNSSGTSNMSELLGDTSILSDLFTSKKKCVDQIDLKTSQRRVKDFWDIVNEGDAERINKLTDLTEVEKICNSATVSTRFRRSEKMDNSQLWKKNEKFLWKH